MSRPDLVPTVRLDDGTVAANARAWAKASLRPVWAVVKSDGYGWGLERMAQNLDHHVEGFCVADAAEFRRLRALTKKPIIVFAQPLEHELAELAFHGAHINVFDPQILARVKELAEQNQQLVRVRIGLAPALGWFGVEEKHLPALMVIAHSRWLEVELWSHFTTPDAYLTERAAFDAFIAQFRAAGVPIAAIDAESSSPLSHSTAVYDRARIGIGLFGAYARAVTGVHNAVSVRAPEITRVASHPGMFIGYAHRPAPEHGALITARLGYGDGFPRQLIGARTESGTILNVGMQYTVIAASREQKAHHDGWCTILDPHDDLAEVVHPTASSAHEVIVNLGNAARRSAN